MTRHNLSGRALALLATASTLCLAVPALAAPASEADRFPLGAGPSGEICRAEADWPGTQQLSKRYGVARDFALRCLGWTRTYGVGHVGRVRGEVAAAANFEAARKQRLTCGAGVETTIAGLGPATLFRCADRQTGLDAFAVNVRKGPHFFGADGLVQFSPVVLKGLYQIAGTAMPKDATLAFDAAPKLEAMAVIEASIETSLLDARQEEVLNYSVRGRHGEAREVATGTVLASDAPPAQQIAFRLESALAASNLDSRVAALAEFAAVTSALEAPDAPGGATGETLRIKLGVYRALDALNRRKYAEASRLSDAALQRLDAVASPAVQTGATSVDALADPTVIRQINARNSRADADVSRAVLQAQALYVRGAAQANAGADATAAATAAATLALANGQLAAAFPGAQLAAPNLQWLRSAIAVEQGRTAEKLGDAAAAGYFDTAVSALADSAVYDGSPLMAQRQIDRAGYRLRHGDRDGALSGYAAAIAVLKVGGPGFASGIASLGPYFALLAEAAQGEGPAAEQAKADFFLAAQFINPPAVAAQIALLQKVYEGGDSASAVRRKTLNDLDREIQAKANSLSSLPLGAAAAADRQRVTAELQIATQDRARLLGELASDQQFLQVNDSAATLTEIQALLRPDEAYFKLLALPAVSYGMVVRNTGARLYRIAGSSKSLESLAALIRRSTQPTKTKQLVAYRTADARRLHEALFGPARDELRDVNLLFAEATGAMSQLPYGVLVTDDASVTRFAGQRDKADMSQINFLAREVGLASTISPRSFAIARSQPASRARNNFIGFGETTIPAADRLQDLPRRVFKGRCPAEDATLRSTFQYTKPISAVELDAAAQTLGGGVVIKGAEFSDTAMAGRKDLGDYAVVQFATHGLAEGEIGCNSAPALLTSVAAEPDSDGLLSMSEIAGLQFDANVVILSACSTAASTSDSQGFVDVGRAGRGATFNGLIRAFLNAGARSVVATHWPIPDATAQPLTNGFVATARTRGMSTALRTAQTGLIASKATSHPYWWGAFFIIGDGEKQLLTRAP